MPKRSNRFQRLIKRIEKTLANDHTTVCESALIVDEKGVEREIDILVQGDVNGHQIKIAIECRDHKRNQHVEWLDSLIGKYTDINVDKVIAVSSTNFSSNASKKAEGHNISLITYGDSQTKEWLAKLKSSFLCGSFTLASPIVSAHWKKWCLISNNTEYLLQDLYGNGSTIVEDDCEYTVGEFGEKLASAVKQFILLNNTELTNSAAEGFNAFLKAGNKNPSETNGSFESTRRIKIDKNDGAIMNIKHSNGTVIPIESAVGDVVAKIDITTLAPTPTRYGNKIVNRENFQMRGLSFDLLHVQDSDRPNKSATSLSVSLGNKNQKIRIGKKTGNPVETLMTTISN